MRRIYQKTKNLRIHDAGISQNGWNNVRRMATPALRPMETPRGSAREPAAKYPVNHDSNHAKSTPTDSVNPNIHRYPQKTVQAGTWEKSVFL